MIYSSKLMFFITFTHFITRAQQEETRNYARSISRQTELRLQQMTPDELDLIKETAILKVDTDVD